MERINPNLVEILFDIYRSYSLIQIWCKRDIVEWNGPDIYGAYNTHLYVLSILERRMTEAKGI